MVTHVNIVRHFVSGRLFARFSSSPLLHLYRTWSHVGGPVLVFIGNWIERVLLFLQGLASNGHFGRKPISILGGLETWRWRFASDVMTLECHSRSFNNQIVKAVFCSSNEKVQGTVVETQNCGLKNPLPGLVIELHLKEICIHNVVLPNAYEPISFSSPTEYY